jgi:Na+/proline symporter
MKETFKNFIAMTIATAIWMSGFLILAGVYYLFESGPVIEEFIFLGIVVLIFLLGIYFSHRSERIKTALEYPFIG